MAQQRPGLFARPPTRLSGKRTASSSQDEKGRRKRKKSGGGETLTTELGVKVPMWIVKRKLNKVQTAEKKVNSKRQLWMHAQKKLEDIQARTRASAGANAKVQKKMENQRNSALKNVEKSRKEYTDAVDRLEAMKKERDNAGTELMKNRKEQEREARMVPEEEKRRHKLREAKKLGLDDVTLLEAEEGAAALDAKAKRMINEHLVTVDRDEALKAGEVLSYVDLGDCTSSDDVRTIATLPATSISDNIWCVPEAHSSERAREYVNEAADELIRKWLEKAKRLSEHRGGRVRRHRRFVRILGEASSNLFNYCPTI